MQRSALFECGSVKGQRRSKSWCPTPGTVLVQLTVASGGDGSLSPAPAPVPLYFVLHFYTLIYVVNNRRRPLSIFESHGKRRQFAIFYVNKMTSKLQTTQMEGRMRSRVPRWSVLQKIPVQTSTCSSGSYLTITAQPSNIEVCTTGKKRYC